ncbi:MULTISPECIES: hypothetical protein [Acidiphilium]|uniref:hypothetical protein n=1 Tax=Acidiphilium TaxID=522 RepID=UPI000B2633FA|nr:MULTISPECIES: hypothetical protein [Acidiphilium]MBS3025011.1 hypothetical protein [Acidiphilium multivorum]MBU6356875.1 hypothetical protein [Rhodospirillales bacterium]MDE2328940.1 hypothetical protein [Rhodospirillales bacterium]UNC13160.1 hypothetical protein FE249_02440 [Acidiphilium multivorum]
MKRAKCQANAAHGAGGKKKPPDEARRFSATDKIAIKKEPKALKPVLQAAEVAVTDRTRDIP